ncbi:MAG: quinone-dependent dihydroorotate dehydrogenase [Armatimonadetes bacterium]|nr:quinone-dependent dihydroorotate dehydrogenase [Armatimonadota bacterium]
MYRRILRPLLFRLDPEAVHDVVSELSAAFFGVPPVRSLAKSLLLVEDPVEIWGLRFANRIGLAAGFDKHGRFVQSAEALGFGHVEVGAVTPLPQPGHPRPRMFRLPELEALRNRMGFNNEGALRIACRLARRFPYEIPVGINLGKGRDTPLEDAWKDYRASFEVLFPWGDFFVVNVSSPNTEGLRDLQHRRSLERIMGALGESNRELSSRFQQHPRPLLLKISPDLEEPALESVAEFLLESGSAGVVAANTTARREPPLEGVPAEGGISGPPLAARALEVVGSLRRYLGPDFPIVGSGGIHDEESARAMLRAGADLLQVYTGFVYEGPGLARRLARATRGWSSSLRVTSEKASP